MDKKYIKKWVNFQNCGLLWWINRTLHLFGWNIVFEYDLDTKELLRVYPSRTYCRGFSRDDEDAGFIRLTKYMWDNIDQIKRGIDPPENL